MKKASLIIRARNEEKHLGDVLKKVISQDFPREDLEVIVVDSGSTDRTVEIAKGTADRVIHIAPQDFTFGRALNIGIAASTGEYPVLLSAHCYPTNNDWLKNLLAPFKNERVALTYGKQRGIDSSPFSERQIFKTWFPNDGKNVQRNSFCNNANAAIRKEVWEKIKYDETLTGLEDLDWAKRVLAYGTGHLTYVPEAEVSHVHDETNRGTFNRYMREGIAYGAIHPNQRFSLFKFARLLMSNIHSDYGAAIKEHSLAKNLFDIPRFRSLQFFGTYVGRNFHSEVDKEVIDRFYYPNKPFRKQDEKI